MTLSDAMRDFVEQARAASIESEVARRGLKLRRAGAELVGPCPVCGGRDRFSINPRKGVFNCRGSGTGGDVIALVEYLDATDFRGACETLTGRPAPSGASEGPDAAEIARREALRLAAETEREQGERDFREEERARMRRVWNEAKPIASGSPVARYLERRGLPVPADAALRALDSRGYFHDGAEIWRGPAMIAAMVDGATLVSGRPVFRGAHVTWIDPATSAKAVIVDPATGEVLPSRKVRGSLRGSHIALSHLRPDVDAPAPRRLVVGEGIETVLSVRLALAAVHGAAYDAATLFWSAIDLGNLGGKAAETIPHPSLVTIDKRGARRRVKVPGPVPAEQADGRAALMPPEHVTEVILLGDGDSERFATEQHLLRAAARWARPGRVIRIAWAGDGLDFNTVLNEVAA